MGKSDSSVVVALSELVRMEETRIEDERAASAAREAERVRAAVQAEAEAKADAKRRTDAAAHAARVAEAEARMRLEADLEQGRRIEAMRAELSRVEAERRALRADLEARAGRPSDDAPRARGWALAFGLSSLVAASLAGLLVMNAQQEPRTVIVEAPRAPIVAAPEIVFAADGVEAVEVPAAAPVVEVATAPETRPAHRSRDPHRPPSHTTGTTGTTTHGDDLGLGADDGSDDVLSPEILDHARRETRRHR